MNTAMENGAGDGRPATKQKKIEGIYQKKSQCEHILLHPDAYISDLWNQYQK